MPLDTNGDPSGIHRGQMQGRAIELARPVDPHLRAHFRAIPDACHSTDFVRVDAYLKLTAEEASGRIPFVWATDDTGQLQRLAVTRRLALACSDRLDYWHTLQELAGIRSF